MDDLQYIANIENLENAENHIQRNNRFNNVDPFEVLNENEFIQIFRMSKELCRFLIETVEPFMRPQRRATDLSVTTRVRFYYKFVAKQEIFFLNFAGFGCITFLCIW